MSTEEANRGAVVVDRTDAFPKRVYNWVPKVTDYNFHDLREIHSRHDIHPFIFYVDHDKVYFKLLKDTWSQKRVDNLKRLAKDAGGCRSDLVKSWDSKASALKNVATSNHYCDRRLSYVFDRHYFLVKSAFTFGLRTVLEDTTHLIQVTQVPLQFYIFPKNGIKRNHRLKMMEKLLAVDEQRYYDHHELKSNTAYRIKPGTKYVLFASQKTFFSVHVLEESMQLPFQTTDPVEEWKTAQRARRNAATTSTYDRPPPTPYMLDEPEFRAPPPPPTPPPPPPQQQQPPAEEPPPAYNLLFPEQDYVNLESPQAEEQQPPQPESRGQQQPPQPESRGQQQQQEQQQLQWNLYFTYALEREIKIVNPDLVKWYQDLKKEYGKVDPLTDQGLLEAGQFQTEPLDLSKSLATTEEEMEQDPATTEEEMEQDPATTILTEETTPATNTLTEEMDPATTTRPTKVKNMQEMDPATTTRPTKVKNFIDFDDLLDIPVESPLYNQILEELSLSAESNN